MVASLLLTLRFTNIHFSNYFYFYVFFCIILGYNSANPLPNVKNKVVNIAVVLVIVQIQALSYIKKNSCVMLCMPKLYNTFFRHVTDNSREII